MDLKELHHKSGQSIAKLAPAGAAQGLLLVTPEYNCSIPGERATSRASGEGLSALRAERIVVVCAASSDMRERGTSARA